MVSLAKRANEAHDLLVWMEELPSVFNHVLMDDFNTEYSYLTFTKIYINIYGNYYYYFKDFTNSIFFWEKDDNLFIDLKIRKITTIKIKRNKFHSNQQMKRIRMSHSLGYNMSQSITLPKSMWEREREREAL